MHVELGLQNHYSGGATCWTFQSSNPSRT